MSIEKQLYEQYLDGLNEMIDNDYGVKVTRNANLQDTFPIVELKPFVKTYQSESLGYAERKDRLGYEINIYAQDTVYGGVKVYADDIIFELADIVDEYFSSEGFRTIFNNNTPNIDILVDRRTIRVEGIFDYTSKKVYKT